VYLSGRRSWEYRYQDDGKAVETCLAPLEHTSGCADGAQSVAIAKIDAQRREVAWAGCDGRLMTLSELVECMEADGTTVLPGDGQKRRRPASATSEVI
jgi:hypothetical protein